MFHIWIVNMLLNMLTFGIHYFWGKVKIRRYAYSQTEFEGDRFAYHGTGKELLIGFLKASPFLLFILFFPALQIFWPSPTVELLGSVCQLAAFAIIVPIAIVGASRYRLSRTSWRGIRFSFRGHTKDFLRLYFKGYLWLIVSGGLYTAFFEVRNRKFLIEHTYFGNSRFRFGGEASDLFKVYLVAGIMGIIGLSISTLVAASVFPPVLLFGFGGTAFGLYCWVKAERERFYWSNTHFDTARFRSTLTTGQVFRVMGTNLLLLIGTLGLAWPVTQVRSWRLRFENLRLEGELDLEAITQEAQLLPAAAGEGFAEFLDLDLGFF